MILKAIYLSLIPISRSLDFYSFSGGGGSCRRQGKSAAPSGRRGERVGRGRIHALFLAKHNRKRNRRGRGGIEPTGPAPSPAPAPPSLLRDMSTKMEGPALAPALAPALRSFFLRVLLKILHRFPLRIMDSTTSDFRPLTFSFRFKPFVFSSERSVFPPLSETFRFLERLQ